METSMRVKSSKVILIYLIIVNQRNKEKEFSTKVTVIFMNVNGWMKE